MLAVTLNLNEETAVLRVAVVVPVQLSTNQEPEVVREIPFLNGKYNR